MVRTSTRLTSATCFVALAFALTACVGPVEPARRANRFNARPPVVVMDPYTPHSYLSPFRYVPVPVDLREVPRGTVILETRGVRTGMATYWSRTPKSSLEVFFRGELVKKGWRLVTAFSATPSTTLLYNRGNFWCMVSMEDRGTTDVRIAVSKDEGLISTILPRTD